MQHPPSASSLARWLQRADTGAPETEPEPADLGTAFGLDMSLLPPDESAAEATNESPNGWLRRLGLPAR